MEINCVLQMTLAFIFLFLLLTPTFLLTTALSTAAMLDPACLSPTEVYFVYMILCTVSICSIISFTFVFLQCVDYIWVRYRYRRHAPRYENRDIAALLALP
ncbi:E3 RID-alpha [simian adenovirus 55]|uniref:E3 RID-alpha n=1 Tax=simian adenovirus 55 TaxID=2848082 RepID=A0A1L3INY7_9ADEN|nr:E3 RID-alpha [Simian mastadenovirus WIV19]APG53812.1 E3 RID-alpha [Simian mastadenovirus WIV19]